jgi:hypothetical protein
MTTKRELEQRVIEAAQVMYKRHQEFEAGEGDNLLAGTALASLIIAVEEHDAAPDDDGWQPDRPGWYWVRRYEFSLWVPYEWITDGDFAPCWRGLAYGDDLFEIGPYILPPAPREEDKDK